MFGPNPGTNLTREVMYSLKVMENTGRLNHEMEALVLRSRLYNHLSAFFHKKLIIEQ